MWGRGKVILLRYRLINIDRIAKNIAEVRGEENISHETFLNRSHFVTARIQTVDKEREYYIRSSRDFGWTRNVLLNHFKQVKMKNENPSIGIILCADKDNIVVEYALRNVKKPIGVAKYYLTKKLPKAFKGKLPDVQDLKQPILQEIKQQNKPL